MKNITKHIYLLALSSMLTLMPMMVRAINYQPYQGAAVSSPVHQSSYTGGDLSSTPAVGFHSTSAFSGQWENKDVQSMLNADGTVNTDAYGVGQRNAPAARKAPGTPGGNLDPNAQQPLGDAVLPLIILACAYTLIRVRKKYIGGTTL